MKKIHLINQIVFIGTCVLYLTIYLGMIAQMVLGFTQVILALSYLITWKELPKSIQSHLKNYYTLILVYGLGVAIANYLKMDNEIVIIGGLFVIPMCIAGYFFKITLLIKRHYELQPISL